VEQVVVQHESRQPREVGTVVGFVELVHYLEATGMPMDRKQMSPETVVADVE